MGNNYIIMQYLNKPIIISANPPENPNVLWAKGDISNPNNIKIGELRQYNNGSWEEVTNESSGGTSLPIEDIISMLPIPFDDEIDIVVLKVHCGIKNAGNDIGEPFVLDNYEFNKYLGALASWIKSAGLVSDTVNTVSATVLFFNGTYRYDVILSGVSGYNGYTHVDEGSLKYYDETEAYAVLPMINTSNPFCFIPLSPTVTWETCSEELKESNKATWKELNEFL